MVFSEFLLLLPLLCAVGCSHEESFKKEKPVFATKTAYGWLPPKNDFFHNPPKLHDRVQYRNQNCTAMHVYTILRHGARNPGLRDTRHMASIQQKLRKIKSFSAITEHLKFWKSPFVESKEGQLIELGKFEHIQNAHHFLAAFENVFFKNQRLQPIRMVSSTKQRCVDSMKAFGDGMKDYLKMHHFNVDDFNRQVKSSYNNTLLRFYDYCTKYQREVKQNWRAMLQYYDFLNGNEIGKVVKKVNQKFKVKDNFFDSGDVRVMYILCAFEQCLLNSSDWCRLLDEKDTRTFEYLSDIKQYWINAYGYKVNYEQSCPIMKDLLHSIDSSVKAHRMGKDYIKGHFLFGHGETLAPVYSSLGLFKDTKPLNARNFEDHLYRKFKSSYVLPFAANIAIVTYHCLPQDGNYILRDDDTVHMERSADYVVQMYVNERLLEIPGCGSTCSLLDFMDKYIKIETCDFNEVCHLCTMSLHFGTFFVLVAGLFYYGLLLI